MACNVLRAGASARAGAPGNTSPSTVDKLLRLEQYRGATAGPEAWAKLYVAPADRPQLMAAG
jgi:hypothetical protein